MSLRQRDDSKAWIKLRFKILKRDNYTCRYCGQFAPNVRLEVDHIIPVSEGGTDEEDNLTTACWACNAGKSGLLLDEHVIRCDEDACESAADTVHITWGLDDVSAACADHDRGGYWFPLREVFRDTEWLRHLSDKRRRPDLLVADWLEKKGRGMVWTLRCVHCERDFPWRTLTRCDTDECSSDVCTQCMPEHVQLSAEYEALMPPRNGASTISFASLPPLPGWMRGRSKWRVPNRVDPLTH